MQQLILRTLIKHQKSFQSWFRKNQSIISKKKHWFNRYIINPVLYVIVKFSDWTDSFTNRGLKNGTRVTIILYLVGFWIFILLTLLLEAIKLLIIVGIIYVLIRLLFSSGNETKFL